MRDWRSLRMRLILSYLVMALLLLTIAGALVSVTLAQEAQSAVLSVIDQGRGIAEADLPLLFECFHRGIDTQEIRGTELGLAIVQEAVGRHGGQIEVESKVGVGSTFRVRLPLV